MAIDTTKDLLFLALTVAVVVLTALLAWLLYYLISIIRQGHRIMQDVSDGFAKLHEILDAIKGTIDRSSSHLALVVSAVKQLVDLSTRRRRKRSENKKTQDAEEE